MAHRAPRADSRPSMAYPRVGGGGFVRALFFDLGVYLIVVGLVLDVLRSLGARIDEEITADEAQAVSR